MSVALDDVCKILNVADEAGRERELLAKNIIAFAHQGQRDVPLLRSHAEGDHLWVEASGLRRSSAPRVKGRCEIPSNVPEDGRDLACRVDLQMFFVTQQRFDSFRQLILMVRQNGAEKLARRPAYGRARARVPFR